VDASDFRRDRGFYHDGMLTAERTSFWKSRYTLAEDGSPLTVWDPSTWSSGGTYELGGRTYRVRANVWGSRWSLLDDTGGVVAEAERFGRKNWQVLSAGRVYGFRRRSLFSSEHELLDGERPVGSIRQTSSWSGSLAADLPGLPRPVQVFVLGIVISEYLAAASAGG
jgi:hypothetical protein